MSLTPRRVLPIVLCVLLGSCLFARAVNGRPGPDALTRSYELEAKGNSAAAIQAMREAVEVAPDDYFPRLRLAYLELGARDYKAAAADYERAARLEPKALEPLLGWLLALNTAEAYGATEAVGQRALSLDPNNYLALSRLAWARYKLGHFAEAANAYKKVLEAYPADLEMRLGYGYAMLGGGNKPEARSAFQRVLAMVPGQLRAKAGLAASR
jgi:tetratricopeptide (TPR) repeat protein